MSRIWSRGLSALLWAAALGHTGGASAQAGILSDLACPSATESPPTPPLGVAIPYLAQEFERNWPQTWVCKAHNQVLANLALAQVRREHDPRTREPAYSIAPISAAEPSPHPRWHANLSWKLYLGARPEDPAPATLIVKAEYQQPSLARFDMFVSLTTKGVRGVASRVLGEAVSKACLSARDDCLHTEEIMLEIPRDALRSAVKTGLLIDLMGHGRTERVAIRKEFIWAFAEKAQLR